MSAWLALALLLSAAAGPPGEVTVTLPNRAGALRARLPARVFRGAELYGHIDGGAEVFLELGFERLEVLDYSDGRDELQLEAYRMSDSAAALGIFLLRGGALEPASSGVRVTSNRFQTQIQRGRLVAIITNSTGNERLATAMASLAQELAATTPAEEDPAVVALLPVDGRVVGSERIIRGPVTLATLVTLGEGDVLSLAGTVTAVAADVRTAGETSTVVVVPYPDGALAATALAALPARLDRSWSRTGAPEGVSLFADSAGRRLTVTREGPSLLLRLSGPSARP